MSREFDVSVVSALGWQQGAILDPEMAAQAWKHAPAWLAPDDRSLLVLTSHDCDVLNHSIAKEPVVEVIRARIADEGHMARSPSSSGRNPRDLRLWPGSVENHDITLDFKVHDRWQIPRETLAAGSPDRFLSHRASRLVSEWLAKRYIRSAFPTAFDARWRRRSREWRKLLARHSRWIQGVYIELDTLAELPATSPYRCSVLLVAPLGHETLHGWVEASRAMEAGVLGFWNQFRPGIVCEDVFVRTTDLITLADIEHHQRFDADWISFEDDTPVVPIRVDFRS